MTVSAATWHRLEHSGYLADLPLWIELAQKAGGSVAELGAGAGRVSHALSRSGFAVVAVDSNASLLQALRSGLSPGVDVRTVEADFTELAHGVLGGCGLVIAPLLSIQLVDDEASIAKALASIAAASNPDCTLAVAVTCDEHNSNRPSEGRARRYRPATGGPAIRSTVTCVSTDAAATHIQRSRAVGRQAGRLDEENLVRLAPGRLRNLAPPNLEWTGVRSVDATGAAIGFEVETFVVVG